MAGEKGDPTVNEKMTAIANAIRDKTGGTEALTLDDMASGVNDVYEAGYSQAERDLYGSFCNVNNPNSQGDFYVSEKPFWGWRYCEYIRPPFKIIPDGYSALYEFFNGCQKLKKVEKEYFDLSHCSSNNGSKYSSSTGNPSTYQMFNYCYELEEIEDIKIPPYYYNRTFFDCNKLKKIEALYFDEKTKMYNAYVFQRCNQLTDLTAYGVIANDAYFQSAKALNVASLISILTILKDFSGTENEFTKTIYLASDSKIKLEAEGNASPNGNSWIDYIEEKGWLLG